MTKRKIYLILLFSLILSKWSLAQFGFSSPLYSGNGAKLLRQRWSAEIQLFLPLYFDLKVKDSTQINLLIEPGVKFNWYNFEKNLIVERSNGLTTFQIDTNDQNIYTNKLFRTSSLMQSTSLSAPIHLIFRPKKIQFLKIATGIYVEYLIGGKFKQNFSNGNHQSNVYKFKDGSNFWGFQRLQFGLCGHVSYKFVTLYGQYSLTPLFISGQGPQLKKINIGIWFNLFWKQYNLKPY